MDYRQIVWLASYPKSGNTWVRCFLDAYFMGKLDLNEILTSIQDDRADLFDLGDGSEPWRMPVDIQHLARPMALLRLVKAYSQSQTGIPLFVKSHSGNLLANGIEMLPMSLTKATVFIVRDPRDVAPSFAAHMGVENEKAIDWMQDKLRNLSASEHRMSDFISSWDYHTNSFLNDDQHNTLVIQYEELKANPVDMFCKLLRHAGVEPDIDRVEQAVEITRLENLKQKESETGFKESSPFAKDQFFGRKHPPLDDRQRYKIEKAFGRVMKRLGYLKQKVA
jgi:hypothetical protein